MITTKEKRAISGKKGASDTIDKLKDQQLNHTPQVPDFQQKCPACEYYTSNGLFDLVFYVPVNMTASVCHTCFFAFKKATTAQKKRFVEGLLAKVEVSI